MSTSRKTPVETTAYAGMMRRMLRAHGRRVADADVEDLAELIAMRETLEEAIAFAVTESRSRHGRSWADIGRAAGTSRQAAEAKWGKGQSFRDLRNAEDRAAWAAVQARR